MPGKQIEAVGSLYRSWGAALTANPEMSLDECRGMIESWTTLTAEPGGVEVGQWSTGIKFETR